MTTKMSEEALANDESLGTPLIPVAEIYIDHNFNCRGRISILDCVQLADDISHRGLQSPIQVRALRTEERGSLQPEYGLLDKGFKYKVIAGHRRLTAYRYNEATLIPATVKDTYISNFEEHDLNAIENLQRSELNFQQEANAIKHYFDAGWTRIDIAEKIGMSPGWVQLRLILLQMPLEIQNLAGKGYIRSSDMNELNKFKQNMPSLMRMAGQLRDMRMKGERGALPKIKRKEKASSKKQRSVPAIQELMAVLQTHCRRIEPRAEVIASDLFTIQGNSIATRALAWATGEISSGDFHKSLQEFFEAFGHHYEMPDFAVGDHELEVDV